jgi:hypothetical protein
MRGKRGKSADPKGVTFLYVPPSETKDTHLAHWPPPRFAHDVKPIITKHSSTETAHRARPRGWRLTRDLFAEFDDEDD